MAARIARISAGGTRPLLMFGVKISPEYKTSRFSEGRRLGAMAANALILEWFSLLERFGRTLAYRRQVMRNRSLRKLAQGAALIALAFPLGLGATDLSVQEIVR